MLFKNEGDIIKAIRGFNEHNNKIPMIMAGSIFAACMDAPGESVWNKLHEDGVKLTHKKYFGSASSNQKGNNKYVEGKEVLLECNRMMYREKLIEIKESIQSVNYYVDAYVDIMIGVGSDINGVFEFNVPQQFDNVKIVDTPAVVDPMTEQVMVPAVTDFSDLEAQYPNGSFSINNLWPYIDLVRSRR